MKQLKCNMFDLVTIFILAYFIVYLVQYQGGLNQCIKKMHYKPFY